MAEQRKKQFEFRVIAGQLKGCRLVAPDLGVTRPPLSRLRKAIFDFLTPYLDRARYLDLFSGTGSYLFEAVSRGAARSVGIEIEQRLAGAINHQAGRYRVSDRLTCLCGDVFGLVPRLAKQGEKFDVIMAAPPQYRGFVDETLQVLNLHPLSSPGGLILFQHDTSETVNSDRLIYRVVQKRKYGNTTFTVLQLPASDEPK